MNKRRSILITVAFSLCILSLGCQTSSQAPNQFVERKALSLSTPSSEKTARPPMALAPGDVIEVKFFYTPQLDEVQTVRPDGKIGLQLIGEINVQGKTPSDVRKELLELYTPHLEEIEVAVIVRSFWNRRVYVGGQVITPGLIEMPGRITALEAITQAGGFDLRTAEPKSVIVIRHKNGKRLGYKLNMNSALAGETTEFFFLEAQDIVYVPRTKIALVNQWIDQYINKIIPDTGMFFRTTRGRTEVGVGSYR